MTKSSISCCQRPFHGTDVLLVFSNQEKAQEYKAFYPSLQDAEIEPLNLDALTRHYNKVKGRKLTFVMDRSPA